MKKNLLLAVTGMSPQVITESIYAFHQQGKAIDEIKIITTLKGKAKIWQGLMESTDTQPAVLQQLITDYDLPPIHFSESNILVISDKSGNPLDDVRSEEEHQALADFITQKVQQETENEQQTVHASIAGGRKTMTFLLGYAMSLYGRHQDTLSHVLVDEGYESSDFFYPTPYSQPLQSRTGQTLDAKNAHVSLALIPFVRLRQELPESLLSGKASYTDAVNVLNLAHHDYTLTIDIPNKQLLINTHCVKLAPAELAFYWWFITQQKETGQPVSSPVNNNPDHSMAHSFADIYAMLTDYIKAENLFNTSFEHDDYGIGMDSNYFSERKTRLNKALEHGFGQHIATQIGVQRIDKQKGRQRYKIALPLTRIEVIEHK